MIDFATLRNSIYTWASANVPVGMPAIWYYPNAPRPTNNGTPIPYISLDILSFIQIGRDWNANPNLNDGVANFVGDREFSLQVQAYGLGAMQTLENLRTSLQKQSVLATLRLSGIAYVNWEPIIDISDLVDSRYQDRATMNLLFRVAQIYTDNLGAIETVEIQEIFKNPAGTTVVDEIVSITIVPP